MKTLIKNKKILFLLLSFLVTLGLTYLLSLSAVLSVLIMVLVLHYKTSTKEPIDNYNLLYLCLLYLLMLASFILILNTSSKFSYLIPLSSIPMLTHILFYNQRIAMLMNLIGAFSLGLLTKDVELSVILFSGAGVGIICVKDIRHRSQILKAGLCVGILQSFSYLLIQKQFSLGDTFFYNLGLNLVNGFLSATLVSVSLPIFEYLFNVTTNISLLELSDFNHPLLKRLAQEAPGTYHHSLIVGNLSETAAGVVGANSLLCRIGAYYHDIGKIIKPEYFAENQRQGNIHTKIKPSISKSIILGHVKEGLELAKKYKLKPTIIDFIAQHHGTSVIYYFFRKALEETEEEMLKEGGFRYPGPRPKTKETAIVLLSDSVEAACRTLKDQTPPKIQNTVQRIINNKFVDGQLDRCDLSLKDLEGIAQAFIRILTTVYHSRIPYPASS